jgi:hypothetical protein
MALEVNEIRSAVPVVLVAVSVSFASGTAACGSYPSSHVTGGTGNVSGTTSGSGGTTSAGSGGAGGGSGSGFSPGDLPCDGFQKAGHPCVSAHSTVRALVGGYTGNLYQVKRSDGTTKDIGVVGGYADAASQDTFCAGSACTISIVYDQSPVGNHLTPAPPGGAKPTPGNPVVANALKVTVNGHMVYGMLFRPGMGYRAACNMCPYPPGGPAGTAVGDEPQTMYMVASQRDLINGCCFDYGNAEVTANDDGNGTMEAVYLGLGVVWGSGVEGGPWAMADLENGLYPGWENGNWSNISTSTPLKYDFVSAVVVGDTRDKNGGKGRFAIYGADATTGVLKTMYDGIRPEKPGYVPMQKQGSVILSIGGDNSDFDGGRFYEGVMVSGAASKETVDALQAAVVAAGYGK